MATPYSSYEAIAVQNAMNMLATSTNFQALVAALSSAAAQAFIIESDGGIPGETKDLQEGQAIAMDGSTLTLVPPFAIVHMGALESELVGVGTFHRSGRITIEVQQKRLLTGEKPAEAMRRARNVLGLIRADLEAAFGGAGNLATGWVASEGPFLPNDVGAESDAIVSVLNVNFVG